MPSLILPVTPKSNPADEITITYNLPGQTQEYTTKIPSPRSGQLLPKIKVNEVWSSSPEAFKRGRQAWESSSGIPSH